MVLRIDINPHRLTWAREAMGLSLEELAQLVDCSETSVEGWEDGSKHPTARQLNKLAERLLRPESFFVLDGIPSDESSPAVSFRRRFNNTSPASYKLLREIEIALARREDFLAIADGLGLEMTPFRPRPSASVEQTVVGIRAALGVNEEDQLPPKSDEYHQGRVWSAAIEQLDVLVFHCSRVSLEDFRGLAINLNPVPVILINGADSPHARAFTLLHEFAHLWLGHNDLTKADLSQVGSREESFCNKVAAELLMPETVVRREVAPDPDLQEVRRKANKLGVSVAALAIRLRNLGLADESVVADALNAAAVATKNAGGGDFYRTQLRNLGRKYAVAVLDAMYSNQISRHSAAELLTASNANGLEKMYGLIAGGH